MSISIPSHPIIFDLYQQPKAPKIRSQKLKNFCSKIRFPPPVLPLRAISCAPSSTPNPKHLNPIKKFKSLLVEKSGIRISGGSRSWSSGPRPLLPARASPLHAELHFLSSRGCSRPCHLSSPPKSFLHARLSLFRVALSSSRVCPAEVRRTRISDRIRKLQGLVPTMDRQTNTADMLDEAVEYVKFLQKQIQELMEHQKNCKCATEG